MNVYETGRVIVHGDCEWLHEDGMTVRGERVNLSIPLVYNVTNE